MGGLPLEGTVPPVWLVIGVLLVVLGVMMRVAGDSSTELPRLGETLALAGLLALVLATP
jgi:drug/metabolite transporter (DMT)-like permease